MDTHLDYLEYHLEISMLSLTQQQQGDFRLIPDVMEAPRQQRAVNECIQAGVLADFLRKNKAEAIKMSIYEYDAERHMRQTREEGYEEGYDNGCKTGQDKVNSLIVKLNEANRITDIIRAAGDEAYQKSLFEEFGL